MKNGTISIDAAIAGSQKNKERDYWLERLSGPLEPVCFPRDRRVPPPKEGDGPRMHTVTFTFTGELFEKLMHVRKDSDNKLFMILVTGLVVLLEKYSGKTDIILGAPVLKQEIDARFINTVLALRNQIHHPVTFKDLLLQVRQTIIEAVEHQNYPIKTLVNQLDVPASDDFFPLFDTAILLKNIHDKKFLDPVTLNMIFSFSRTPGSMEGELEYRPGLYEEATMRRIVNHFSNLLLRALTDVNREVSGIPVLSEAERHQLLVEFNNNRMDIPVRGRTVHAAFEDWVEKKPAAAAAVYEEGHVTYRELDRRAGILAEILRVKGVIPGQTVGIMVDRSIELVFGILGILKAGGAYLPIDWEYPEARNVFMLKDSRTRLVLAHSHLIPGCKGMLAHLPGENVIPLDDPGLYFRGSQTRPVPGQDPVPSPRGDDLAYVIYTSGTSGVPKGVMVEHRNVINLVYGLHETVYKNYPARLNVGLVSPYVFDASVKQLFGALLLGHTLHVVPAAARGDGIELLRFFRKYAVDISDGTPLHLRVLVESTAGTGPFPLSPMPVKNFLIGGEALPWKTAADFLGACGNTGPEITNVYGPTECCVDSALYTVPTISTLSTAGHDLSGTVPIGKPMPNQQIYILDADGRPQPTGVPGELHIAGDNVSRGYLNRPELTNSKFQITNYNPPAEGPSSTTPYPLPLTPLYRTGDLARWLSSEGSIEYRGRVDHQVKIRGFRIELGEIENELLKFDAVETAVVEAKEIFDGEKDLCAYFTAKHPPEPNELRAFLSGRLPDYLIPMYFIRMDRLPVTPNGKIDRRALPLPELNTDARYTPPTNKTEEKLTAIWSDVLAMDRKEIGIDHDFFRMGGHSLKAAILIAKIHKELDAKLSLGQIFNHPTIRELALHIHETREQGERFTAIEPAEKKEYYPISSAQKRMYVLQRINPRSKDYNLPVVVVKMEGPLDRQKLENAFESIVRRHDSFRTSFVDIHGEPVQVIHPADTLDFTVDYFETPEENAGEHVNRYIRAFDLSRAPLLRAGLVKIGEEKHILMVDMHHIVSDATSTQLFIRDLIDLYNGRTPDDIPIKYRDFSEWHNRLVRSGEIAKQEEYWLREFAGKIPVLTIPLDFPRPAVRSLEGNKILFKLDDPAVESLKALADRQGATLYMVLFALFKVLLFKLSGQEDIVVGADHAGRRHADLEPIIGMFVNTFAIRTRPSGEMTFMQFLDRVKQKTLDAFENQDFQFENLVDKVLANRDPGRNPLYDVMFSFHNVQKMEEEDIRRETAEGLTFSSYGFRHEISKFDLMLHGEDRNGNVRFSMEYCTKLFRQETIENYIAFFKKIASDAAANPGILLDDIQVIAGDMKARLLERIRNERGEEAAVVPVEPDESEARFDL